MKRTKLKAVEVENKMQEARETRMIDGDLVPFTGGLEKSHILDIIKFGKTTGKIGDKVLITVNPLYIHIPKWQREIRIAKALDIGNNYDTNQWGLPKFFPLNGKLYCGDGMHRIFGAFMAGIDSVVGEFMEITEKEAMDLFLNQTKGCTGMTQSDYLGAALGSGKPDYILFQKICKNNNVKIKGDDIELKNPVGIFTSLSDGLRIVNKNPELLDRMLKLLGKLKWNGVNYADGKAYSAKVIRVIEKLYAYYDGSEKAMEKCLLNNCKGAEYFNNNIYEKYQDTMFDFLSYILETNIITESNISTMPERDAHGRFAKAN